MAKKAHFLFIDPLEEEAQIFSQEFKETIQLFDIISAYILFEKGLFFDHTFTLMLNNLRAFYLYKTIILQDIL